MCIVNCNKSQKVSKSSKNISGTDTQLHLNLPPFLFLPHFDFTCDLLHVLNRGIATSNPFVTQTSANQDFNLLIMSMITEIIRQQKRPNKLLKTATKFEKQNTNQLNIFIIYKHEKQNEPTVYITSTGKWQMNCLLCCSVTSMAPSLSYNLGCC